MDLEKIEGLDEGQMIRIEELTVRTILYMENAQVHSRVKDWRKVAWATQTRDFEWSRCIYKDAQRMRS